MREGHGRKIVLVLVGMAVSLCLIGRAEATLITFKFSGNVTNVDAGLAGAFNTSQTMSGSWTIDTLAADQNINPQQGTYSLSKFEISVDGFAPTVTGGQYIINNDFLIDNLQINVTDPFNSTIDAPTVVAGQDLFQIFIDFNDLTNLVFSSDELVTNFNLSDFSNTGWSLVFGQVNQNVFGRVSGVITDLVVVPEPPALPLFVIGLAGLGIVSWRHKHKHSTQTV